MRRALYEPMKRLRKSKRGERKDKAGDRWDENGREQIAKYEK